MTRIVVVGDTHVRRWDEMHEALRRAVAEADIAVHCGDWVGLDAVEGFRAAARRAVLVHGNSDTTEVRRALPYREVFEVEGVRIGVTHPAWGGPEFPPTDLLPDFPRREFGPIHVVCYGHLHEPLHEQVEGIHFVNGGQGYASFLVPGTYAELTVANGDIAVRIVEFEPAR